MILFNNLISRAECVSVESRAKVLKNHQAGLHTWRNTIRALASKAGFWYKELEQLDAKISEWLEDVVELEAWDSE